eukprot:gene5224-5602_t
MTLFTMIFVIFILAIVGYVNAWRNNCFRSSRITRQLVNPLRYRNSNSHEGHSTSQEPLKVPKAVSTTPSKSEFLDKTNEVNPTDYNIPPIIESANKWTVGVVKSLLMTLYGDRNYARFAALETIARVPYFSYTSVLHLYETLGWFRQKEYIKIHFAESWNELHHLLIMESLGGNDKYIDRLIAQHIAFFYYWIVVFLYMSFPAVAYNLNKQVESHAYDTYNQFLEEYGDDLKKLPPPAIAKEYYEKEEELYMFDAFHHDGIISADRNHSVDSKRRPTINNLYDVFYHIREDEMEHAKTMEALQKNVCEKKLVTRERNLNKKPREE